MFQNIPELRRLFQRKFLIKYSWVFQNSNQDVKTIPQSKVFIKVAYSNILFSKNI